MEHEELTKEIIAAAYDVYNRMGFGFLGGGGAGGGGNNPLGIKL